ncbi:MAG: tetratricopeptide repeat protein [Desulfosudaceae bacterium]
MKLFCKYHPTRPAHWTCPGCQAHLCPDCVLEREKGSQGVVYGKIYLCPQCRLQADWVGASSLIEPFWQRLPVFFAYPFKSQPLLFNILLTILAVFFGWVPFFNLVLFAILIKYAYMILQKTIYGDLRPPAYNTIIDFNNMLPVIKQWFLFFLLGVLGIFVFGPAGMVGGLLYIMAAIFLTPAMIILLATSERLSHALNPVMSVGMVMRIGAGYLLMWFLLALLFFAPSTLIYLTSKVLPVYVNVFIVHFAQNYYTFVAYFLMGYVILQYHERLNYSIDFEDFHDPAAEPKQAAEAADPQQEIIDQAEIMTKEGKPEEALDYIREMTAAGGIASLVLLERFYRLLHLQKEVPEMMEQGSELIHKLVKEKEQKKACQVYIECVSQSKDFQPASYDLFKLGGWFQESGQIKAAANALNRLIKYYPEDPFAPKAYFQLARIYNENLNDAARSRKIITVLKKRHPDHDIIPFAERYLAGLEA